MARYSTRAKLTTIHYAPEDLGAVDKELLLEPINNMLSYFDLLPEHVKSFDKSRPLPRSEFLGEDLTSEFLKILNEVISVFDDFG
jgi:hypothetical protein